MRIDDDQDAVWLRVQVLAGTHSAPASCHVGYRSCFYRAVAPGTGVLRFVEDGKTFSMPSLIGLIMLMGVPTKNSILLVKYAIVARRDHGMDRTHAILDACHKPARPAIMTTIAMGAGMRPIAVGWGAADSSFRSPMATAVIGGLITSTFLSLLVIPAVFTVVDGVALFFGRLFGRGGEGHASQGGESNPGVHALPSTGH